MKLFLIALLSSICLGCQYQVPPNDLGSTNFDVTVNNPLKGLCTSPNWTQPNINAPIRSTLEFYYLKFNDLMRGPDEFDWSVTDQTIEDAISRNHHVVWRPYLWYPGREHALPDFLNTSAVVQGDYLKFNDDVLINTLQNFIAAFGARYDGNTTVAFIQLGLLGKWGEWHTYPENDLLPDLTKQKIADSYLLAFKKTQLLVRDPEDGGPNKLFGYHDDSFGYSTLDGPANGDETKPWFFWPKILRSENADFWTKFAMGGETRPELQDEIFTRGYKARTPFKQDFMECVKVTHATFMVTGSAFNEGEYSGKELDNAKRAHAEMGYNFRVTKVMAKTVGSSVSVEVTLLQTGVAPFYYPLSLTLACSGYTQNKGGVEGLIENGSSSVFVFTDVPNNSDCLNNVKVSLESPYLYAGNPIKFAQGDGTINVNIPVCGNPVPANNTTSDTVPPNNTTSDTVPAHNMPNDVTPTLSVAGTTFSTNHGDVQFTSNSEGVYPRYDGKLVEGIFDSRTMVLSGKWVEPGSGRCSQGPEGSTNYGIFKFKFTENLSSFSGGWDRCDADVNVENPARSWTGTQK